MFASRPSFLSNSLTHCSEADKEGKEDGRRVRKSTLKAKKIKKQVRDNLSLATI